MAITSKKFYWSGFKHGLAIKGFLHADNISEAKHILLKQNIDVRYIFQEKKKIDIKQQVLFFKQLSTLLTANISILRALEIIKNTNNNALIQQKVSGYIEKLQQGNSISTIFYDLEHFNLQLLVIGEKTGRIEQAFETISYSIHQKWQHRKDIIKTITYPAILLLISCLLMTGLLIWVVPQFEAIFLAFHADLPLITQLLISTAHLISNHLILLANLIFSLFFIGQYLTTKILIKNLIDKYSLKIPVLSFLKHHYYSLQFFQAISILTESGISISDALFIIEKNNRHNFFHKIVHSILLHIRQGKTLHQAMKNASFFSEISIQMLHVAEESGQLDFIFKYLASYHQQQFQDAILLLKQLLEPGIMLLMALFVGLLLFALYLPIFKLGSIF